MGKDEFIDSGAACRVLGVRRQTLYAYVSRKLIRAAADPADPRRSLYFRADIEQMLAAQQRPRARADVAAAAIRWGDPVLETSISGIQDGDLYFGQRRALDAAESMTLEDVLAHHCRCPISRECDPEPEASPQASTPLARGLLFLTGKVISAQQTMKRCRRQLAEQGANLLPGFAAAMLGAPIGAGSPIHQQMGQLWKLSTHETGLVRSTMVLLSDHELNPSTFSVRIAASTGASLPASLLAGLSTLSGPLHGGSADGARMALEAGLRGRKGCEAFMAANAPRNPYEFGFEHPLYPMGDPRAAHLLAFLGARNPYSKAVARMSQSVGAKPNIDAALAAVTMQCRLPQEAAFQIFAISRLTGWVAHAIEQVESGAMIRPRARLKAETPAANADWPS